MIVLLYFFSSHAIRFISHHVIVGDFRDFIKIFETSLAWRLLRDVGFMEALWRINRVTKDVRFAEGAYCDCGDRILLLIRMTFHRTKNFAIVCVIRDDKIMLEIQSYFDVSLISRWSWQRHDIYYESSAHSFSVCDLSPFLFHSKQSHLKNDT